MDALATGGLVTRSRGTLASDETSSFFALLRRTGRGLTNEGV